MWMLCKNNDFFLTMLCHHHIHQWLLFEAGWGVGVWPEWSGRLVHGSAARHLATRRSCAPTSLELRINLLLTLLHKLGMLHSSLSYLTSNSQIRIHHFVVTESLDMKMWWRLAKFFFRKVVVVSIPAVSLGVVTSLWLSVSPSQWQVEDEGTPESRSKNQVTSRRH